MTLLNPLFSLFLIDHMFKAMNLQNFTAVPFIDLSAAFDTIHHSILLECQSSWFESQPKNQRCSISNSYML